MWTPYKGRAKTMIYTNTHKRLLSKTIYWIRLIIWRWNQDVGRSDLGRYNLGALKPDTLTSIPLHSYYYWFSIWYWLALKYQGLTSDENASDKFADTQRLYVRFRRNTNGNESSCSNHDNCTERVRQFIGESCLINICLSLPDDANKIKTLNIERE